MYGVSFVNCYGIDMSYLYADMCYLSIFMLSVCVKSNKVDCIDFLCEIIYPICFLITDLALLPLCIKCNGIYIDVTLLYVIIKVCYICMNSQSQFFKGRSVNLGLVYCVIGYVIVFLSLMFHIVYVYNISYCLNNCTKLKMFYLIIMNILMCIYKLNIYCTHTLDKLQDGTLHKHNNTQYLYKYIPVHFIFCDGWLNIFCYSPCTTLMTECVMIIWDHWLFVLVELNFTND